jgi:hypothetical protein
MLSSMQVRLFDGTSVREAFDPSATLNDVKKWVQRALAEQAAPKPAPSAGDDGSECASPLSGSTSLSARSDGEEQK